MERTELLGQTGRYHGCRRAAPMERYDDLDADHDTHADQWTPPRIGSELALINGNDLTGSHGCLSPNPASTRTVLRLVHDRRDLNIDGTISTPATSPHRAKLRGIRGPASADGLLIGKRRRAGIRLWRAAQALEAFWRRGWLARQDIASMPTGALATLRYPGGSVPVRLSVPDGTM